ncbi:MAG TPA: hydrogenase iron-sulfur subunit [Candidatus Krumholzibacteriaceae bacterium]|nr:hydrogenase iron-sulfur subunit [Candidatus Krumholzibacteriaceae bacterium]
MPKEFKPKIISFLCKWCTYSGADLAGTNRMKYPASILPVRVMCSSRVNPVFMVKSFLHGADGVLVGGCHPGDCHYQSGNYFTRRRFAILKRIFDTLGMESKRLKLSWISAAEGAKFVRVTTEFTEEIKSLGENPAKKKVFL